MSEAHILSMKTTNGYASKMRGLLAGGNSATTESDILFSYGKGHKKDRTKIRISNYCIKFSWAHPEVEHSVGTDFPLRFCHILS